jgi:hypothetical protein
VTINSIKRNTLKIMRSHSHFCKFTLILTEKYWKGLKSNSVYKKVLLLKFCKKPNSRQKWGTFGTPFEISGKGYFQKLISEKGYSTAGHSKQGCQLREIQSTNIFKKSKSTNKKYEIRTKINQRFILFRQIKNWNKLQIQK